MDFLKLDRVIIDWARKYGKQFVFYRNKNNITFDIKINSSECRPVPEIILLYKMKICLRKKNIQYFFGEIFGFRPKSFPQNKDVILFFLIWILKKYFSLKLILKQ